MKFFRYAADRVPYSLFVSYFAIDVALFFVVDNFWAPPLIFLLGVPPKAFICAFNHHHQHLPTFYQAPINRLMEFMYFFQTGIGIHGWYLHHSRGHHEHYLDQTKDESAWKRPDGTQMGELEYTFIVAATAYWRGFKRGMQLPKKNKVIVFSLALIAQFGVLGLAFWHNWYNALFIFAIPATVSLLITVWVTYYHHRGLDTDDHMEASYNIVGPRFNKLTGNLGYHTAHHYRPGIHWSKLPEMHAKIEDKIPAYCYRDGQLFAGLIARRKAKKLRKQKQRERRARGLAAA